MAGGYYGGLLEGFTGRRDKHIAQQQEQDLQRRQTEGKIYEHLLQSTDPEIQRMALAGLFESARPGNKSKGLKGFLGDLEGSQMLPLLQQYMNEPVPDTGPSGGGVGGGPSPPQPMSAAMSANIPVNPGSAPINAAPAGVPGGGMGPAPAAMGPPTEAGIHPAAVGAPGAGDGGAPAGPVLGGAGSVGMPPPPLQGSSPLQPATMVPSGFHRRGTKIPTAEEIAEMNARIPLQTRVGVARQNLPPDMAQEAIMGILGAPRRAASFGNVSYGVKLPDGKVVPVSRNQRDGSFVMQGPNGTPIPVPQDAEIVKLGGSGQALKRNVVPDPDTGTGYSAVYTDPVSGEEAWRTETIAPPPPPAYSGTAEFADPNAPTVPVRGGVPRGGGKPVTLGDVPGEEKPQVQHDAESLQQIIDKRIQDERRPGLPVRPGRRDAISAEEAGKMKLPWKTYAEVVRAAKAAPPVTPRQKAEGGTMAERIRKRVEQNRRGMGGAGGAGGGGEESPPPPMK